MVEAASGVLRAGPQRDPSGAYARSVFARLAASCGNPRALSPPSRILSPGAAAKSVGPPIERRFLSVGSGRLPSSRRSSWRIISWMSHPRMEAIRCRAASSRRLTRS
jgi:hypothetical protein